MKKLKTGFGVTLATTLLLAWPANAQLSREGGQTQINADKLDVAERERLDAGGKSPVGVAGKACRTVPLIAALEVLFGDPRPIARQSKRQRHVAGRILPQARFSDWADHRTSRRRHRLQGRSPPLPNPRGQGSRI